MKTISLFATCAAGALLLASCASMTSNEKNPSTISKADVDEISYYVGYSFGQYIASNDMGALSLSQINKGIKDAVAGVEVDEDEFYSKMEEFMEKRSDAKLEINTAEAEAFFKKNAAKEGVNTTESGLQYKIVRDGNGKKPGPEDEVEVNYEGTLLDGTVFDSSYERGETATFSLDMVINGWSEGIQHCEEGGEILLWIPSELAYGERGAGSQIGPGAALQFRVELVKIL